MIPAFFKHDRPSREESPSAGLGPMPRPPRRESSAGSEAVTREVPAPANVAEWLVQELWRRGVRTIAGIPGGAILPLYDALASSPIRHVLARHEQGAAFIAHGMARVTGEVAVVLATSGPGATNLVTALADAWADSVPIVAITAQVPRPLQGTCAFQEVDIVAITKPITKASWLVQEPEDLPELVARAFRLALSGRPGPVLLDIPKDVLKHPYLPGAAPAPRGRSQALTPLELSSSDHDRPRATGTPASRARLLAADSDVTWELLAQRLASSARPLLYVGGGVQAAATAARLRELAERADVPVVCSLHGLGAFPGRHPLCLGMLGMHGLPVANLATSEADFVLAIGVRFDDRATGDPKAFCPAAEVVHLDIDPAEIGRLRPVSWGVAVDAGVALGQLLRCVNVQERPEWRSRLQMLGHRDLRRWQSSIGELLAALRARFPDETPVTTDVGQHQMWVAQSFPFSRPRTWLTSGGLGTMGFGLPAAIGAALARPDHPVLCVSGDGSLLMNLQELATLADLELNVVVLVLNNQELGMVRQQQAQFYEGKFSASQFRQSLDFAAVARAFGIRAVSVSAAELEPEALAGRGCPGPGSATAQLVEALSQRGPLLVEWRTAADEVFPVVPAGAANSAMLFRD